MTIGNTVKTIRAQAFKGVRELTTVSIPSSVDYIGAEAFLIVSLTDVVFEQPQEWVGMNLNNSEKLVLVDVQDSAKMADWFTYLYRSLTWRKPHI